MTEKEKRRLLQLVYKILKNKELTENEQKDYGRLMKLWDKERP